MSFVERYLELKDKKSEIDAEAKRLETEMKTAYCKVVEAMGVNCKAHLQVLQNPILFLIIRFTGQELIRKIWSG